MASASNKTTTTTTRRVAAPVAPPPTIPASQTAQPPVSVLADREKAAKAVAAQAAGWANAAKVRATQPPAETTVTLAAAKMAVQAATGVEPTQLPPSVFNDGVKVERGVLEEPLEFDSPEEEEDSEDLTDDEIEAILAAARAKKRRAVSPVARLKEIPPVKAAEIENKFVANIDFGYGDEFKPHGLSRGQVFELRGLRNDVKLVERGYCRPLSKHDTIYECSIDGGKFVDITYRDEHVRRCYKHRNALDQDRYEDERQAQLAEVAQIKIPGADAPVQLSR